MQLNRMIIININYRILIIHRILVCDYSKDRRLCAPEKSSVLVIWNSIAQRKEKVLEWVPLKMPISPWECLLIWLSLLKKIFWYLAVCFSFDVFPETKKIISCACFYNDSCRSLSDIIHPISQIFATFSAIKRWVGLMRKKTGQLFILLPVTPVTRKAIGLSSTQRTAKFLGTITSAIFGCHQSRDFVHGESGFCCQQETKVSWALWSNLSSSKYTDFLRSTIRYHKNACFGRYAVEDNYREVFRHKMAESAQDFYTELRWTTWTVYIVCCYDFLVLFVLFKLTINCRILCLLYAVCFMVSLLSRRVKVSHREQAIYLA